MLKLEKVMPPKWDNKEMLWIVVLKMKDDNIGVYDQIIKFVCLESYTNWYNECIKINHQKTR